MEIFLTDTAGDCDFCYDAAAPAQYAVYCRHFLVAAVVAGDGAVGELRVFLKDIAEELVCRICHHVVARCVAGEELKPQVEFVNDAGMNGENYLLIAKLAAILRLANAMDRSHYQKVEKLQAVLKDRKLTLLVDSTKDMSLELGLLKDKVEFFEEVFGIRLELRRKKKV